MLLCTHTQLLSTGNLRIVAYFLIAGSETITIGMFGELVMEDSSIGQAASVF
jgi:hypothetical protein